MLTREQRKEKNTAFWDQLRIRMRKHRSTNGKAINWINYPSDVKDIYIRMEVEPDAIRLCLDVQPKDDGIRSILWEQLTEMKKVIFLEMQEDGLWKEDSHILSGRMVSRLCWEKKGLNYLVDEDLPAIYEWLEAKLRSFDRFYQEYKEILIHLAD
jgi:hypothetical protein